MRKIILLLLIVTILFHMVSARAEITWTGDWYLIAEGTDWGAMTPVENNVQLTLKENWSALLQTGEESTEWKWDYALGTIVLTRGDDECILLRNKMGGKYLMLEEDEGFLLFGRESVLVKEGRTVIAAESEEDFIGLWRSKQVYIAGGRMPPDVLDLSNTLEIDSWHVTMVDKGGEVRSPIEFENGMLKFYVRYGGFVTLLLCDNGQACLWLMMDGSEVWIFFNREDV